MFLKCTTTYLDVKLSYFKKKRTSTAESYEKGFTEYGNYSLIWPEVPLQKIVHFLVPHNTSMWWDFIQVMVSARWQYIVSLSLHSTPSTNPNKCNKSALKFTHKGERTPILLSRCNNIQYYFSIKTQETRWQKESSHPLDWRNHKSRVYSYVSIGIMHPIPCMTNTKVQRLSSFYATK